MKDKTPICFERDFLTSGEFASLRNVNLNSLRYYEKLGLLIPAWVDPDTKYRYFRLEQLSTLDTILFFIEVGLPLKVMKNYIDENGNLDQLRVFEDGQKVMEEKIAVMNDKLMTTKFDLLNMERNRWCNTREGLFEREIDQRDLFISPFTEPWESPILREKQSMSVFYEAQKANMLPTFPAGILLEMGKESINYSFFVQVLRASEKNAKVIHVPKGKYVCLQVELVWRLDIPKIIREQFGDCSGKRIILNHIPRDTHHYASRYIEIQVLTD